MPDAVRSPDAMLERRVRDLSAAELFEEALRRFEEAGWCRGNWQVVLHVQEGRVARADARHMDREAARPVYRRRWLEQR